ncbi:MAG: response regulator [Dehalogenimonas sp.]
MNTKSFRLLLVEDNPGDARLIQETLNETEGVAFDLTVAERLAIAAEYVKETFNIVLLDLGLPDSQGLDTLETVVSLNPELPVVVLTGLDDKHVGLEAVRSGAQDFLVKGKTDGDGLWRVINFAIERKKMHQILAQKELLLNQAQHTAHVGSWLWHVESNRLEWSDEMFHIFGIEKEGFSGDLTKVIADSVYPDDVPKVEASGQSVIADNKPVSLEYRIVRPDGNIRHVWAEAGELVLNSSGKPETLIGIVQDITERKLNEEALQKSQQQLKLMLDQLPCILWTMDKDLRYTSASGTGLQTSGNSSADLVGKTIFEYSPKFTEDSPFVICLRKALAGKSESIEEPAVKNSRIFLIYMEPIYDTDKNIIGIAGVSIDITERKIAEEENRQLQNKAEMSSRLAAVGEMAAGIAHEINNPLTGVIGFSELLMEREDLPDDIQEYLKIINDGSIRVKEIVRRMLTFARQSKPEKSSVDITELIENTLELRSYVLKTSNIEVKREYDPELPWVSVDSGQLQQVFLNIIVNAEYAMKKAHDKGVLSITTEKLDGHIRVSISDNGPGMSKEVKDKLFQPFFTTKDPGEGTGLGLSLSFGIVQEHGGTIRVESVVGQGSTFVIELPVPPPNNEQPEQELLNNEAAPLKMKQAAVLMLDDEPVIIELLETIFGGYGHLLDGADNPGEALEKLSEKYYDLIMLDVRMPGMSGPEFYEEIKKRWPEQARRVIFITGDTSDLLTREYLVEHRIPYISKPFDREKLEEIVNGFLSR